MFLIVQCHRDEDDVKFLHSVISGLLLLLLCATFLNLIHLFHIFIDVIKHMYYSRVWMGDEGSK